MQQGAPVVWGHHDPIGVGTADRELAALLARSDNEALVHKGYRDLLTETTLRAVLDDLGVTRLVVLGGANGFPHPDDDTEDSGRRVWRRTRG